MRKIWSRRERGQKKGDEDEGGRGAGKTNIRGGGRCYAIRRGSVRKKK